MIRENKLLREAKFSGIDPAELHEAGRENISSLVRKWPKKYLPEKIQIGLSSFAAQVEQWEPGANYIVAGQHAAGARALALAFAENFATHDGHVIWICINDDLERMSLQLMFKIAGPELAAAGTVVQLDAVAMQTEVCSRANQCDVDRYYW